MLRLRLAAVVLAVASAALAAAPAPAAARSRVVLAFLPTDTKPLQDTTISPPTILDLIAMRPQLSLGLLGATQGRYSPEQTHLDITQGTRVSIAAYSPRDPPELKFFREGRGAFFQGWLDVEARANTPPADIEPGLLGARVPGGTAYAGVTGRAQLEALPAVNRAGRITEVSLGRADTVAKRAMSLVARYRFVVVGLSTGPRGESGLDTLIRARKPDELLLVVQTPPPFKAPQLLPIGVVGLGHGPPRNLTSTSTHLDGIVAGIDLLPTVLGRLGVKVPDAVKGQPITLDGGPRDADALKTLSDRLRVVGARRFPALETVLAGWLAALLLLGVFWDQRGVRAAMRIGALAFLWILPMLLVTAIIKPSRIAELAILVAGTFLLAVVTDLLVPWPRGPAVPGIVTVVAYSIDLARGSDLIIRSLLGPNPRFGSRYYGIGNELEATLPILLFIGLGALFWRRGRSSAAAAAFGVSGVALAAVVGSGSLGADVGGVITIGSGTAVATLFMLPGRLSRRRIVLAIVTPVAGLVALAVLDLATGSNSHFSRTVLHAHGEGALQDIVVRRYKLAFNVLKRGLMPFATAISLLTIAYGLRYRQRVFASLGGDAAWTAAFAGSLASSIAGSLFNDSGPLLLIFGTFALACVTAYVRGDPRLAREIPERVPISIDHAQMGR